MFRHCIIMAVVVFAGAAGAAEPPNPKETNAKATFYSGDVLRRAIEDIGHMPGAELRSFTRYLSECDDELVDDVPTRHACRTAETTYKIEFGAKRALDDLIVARSLLNSFQIARTTPEPADVEMIVNQMGVILALENAARNRFRALKSK
jgi:hypothetical protein